MISAVESFGMRTIARPLRAVLMRLMIDFVLVPARLRGEMSRLLLLTISIGMSASAA